MDITGTINAGMSKMARSMRNGVDNCKTDGKIAEKQKLIKSFVKYAGEKDFKSILYESLVGTPIEHDLDSVNNKYLF